MIHKRYTVLRTSLGDLFITADREHILRIDTVEPHVCTAMRQDRHPLLRDSTRMLKEYLSGQCRDNPVDLPMKLMPFQRQVFTAVSTIPYGHSITSAELAARIGKPHAVRAVETVCRNNPLYILIPCHRVITTEERRPPGTHALMTDEALRRLEKRYLDKDDKRR